EIDRELAEFDVVFANLVQQEEIQAGSKLASDIVNAVDIREAVAAPATVLAIFREMRDRFTPAAIHEHTRALFEGDVIRAVMLTPPAGEGDAGAWRTAMLAQPDGESFARAEGDAVAIAELPDIGEAQEPVARQAIGQLYGRDVERLDFANGVRAMM